MANRRIMQIPPINSIAPARRRLAFEGTVLILLLALTALRLMVADKAPLSADEAYYWQWTRPLQLSYFDHPAMVAYWIKLGLLALGDDPLGVRLPAVLGALFTSLFVWDATKTAFSSRLAGALAALWLNTTLSFGAAAVIMTPDAPLLLAWSAGLWAAIRLMVSGRAGYLYALALALGLGAISKYTMALILPGLAGTFLAFRALWPWWKSRHGWRAVLLALFCTLPLLIWNFQHDWASFAKQLGHAFATTPPNGFKNLLDFLGSQIGLVTPLIFVFALWGMGWALYAGWRHNRPEWFLLGATSAPVLLFFLHHTQSGVVQAHWAGPAYLGAIMATAGWLTRTRLSGLPARLVRLAPLLGAVITGLVYLQAATAMLPIPVRIDALKRLGGWDELAAGLAEERSAHPGAFLFTQNHEPTGPLSFHLPDHPPVFLEGPIRPSYYSAAEVEALKGRDGLFVTRAKDDGAGDLGPYFAEVEPLRTVVMHWGDREAERYRIYLAKSYKGGLFVTGNGFNGQRDVAAGPAEKGSGAE